MSVVSISEQSGAEHARTVASRTFPCRLSILWPVPTEALTASLKAELLRVKRAARDDDQLANEQLPNGVDGTVAKLRGK